MKGRKHILLLMVLVLTVMMLGGCGGEKEPQEVEYEATQPVDVTEQQPEQQEQEEEEEEPVDTHEGQAQSKITGLWMDEEKANLRPYAFMINNIKFVNPQSGISEASVMYEALVEGGITRLLAVFEDFGTNRIGSIRSARHYYASFADEYDAIFVHYGETKYATKKMAEIDIDNISGLEGAVEPIAFYRDKSIKEPHNVFASYESIMKGTEKKGYRTEREADWENHYTFYEEDTELTNGQAANKVELGFSSYTTPYFEYDEEEKLYGRFQFGGAHVDANTGEQLKFKNVIVQFVKEWNIDKNGYQTMDIENSSGKGWYITNGKAVPITWQKNESTDKMHYYGEDGEILKVNAGKTFIAVFPDSRTDKVVFTGKAE